jgi:acyl-CoA synthetase (AMP-forming)/AMP-acid ligase II
VRFACVTGVPHPARGENIAAFIVAADETCTGDELRAFCQTRLASYKVPRHLFFCRENELPVLGSGKIDRRRLRALAVQRTAADEPGAT